MDFLKAHFNLQWSQLTGDPYFFFEWTHLLQRGPLKAAGNLQKVQLDGCVCVCVFVCVCVCVCVQGIINDNHWVPS